MAEKKVTTRRRTPASNGRARERTRVSETAARAATPAPRQLFAPVPAPTRVDYPQLEDAVQRFWNDHDILEKYLHRNDHSARRMPFMDGPITANNAIAVHHSGSRTYKDVWQRFHTMRGFRQRYQNRVH